QAMPAWQQHGPHGVDRAGHGAAPMVVGPAQTTASARKGLSTVVATPARTAPPSIFSAVRREVAAAPRAKASNRSLTWASRLVSSPGNAAHGRVACPATWSWAPVGGGLLPEHNSLLPMVLWAI